MFAEHRIGKEILEKLNPRLSREMWFPFPFSIHHTCQTPRATPGEHPTFTNGKKSFRFVRAHHLLPEETKQESFLLHRCTKGRACCTLNLARSESCNQRISQASTVQVLSAAGSSLLQPLDTARASPELLEMDGLQLGCVSCGPCKEQKTSRVPVCHTSERALAHSQLHTFVQLCPCLLLPVGCPGSVLCCAVAFREVDFSFPPSTL